MDPRSSRGFLDEYQVDPLDIEIRARHELALAYTGKIDDRKISIEIQSNSAVKLNANNVLAVIIPEEWATSVKLNKLIHDLGAQLLTYPTFPLKQEMYYALIYNIVFELYREKHLIR